MIVVELPKDVAIKVTVALEVVIKEIHTIGSIR
jgi:hypothetical protein